MAAVGRVSSTWQKFKVQSKLGLSQAILYLLSVILAFLVCVPMGIVLRNFFGRCILFAQVVWNGMTIYPWSESSCEFVLYWSLGANMIYPLMMGLFTLFAVLPRTQKSIHLYKVGQIQAGNARYILMAINPVFLLVNIVVLLLTLCQAVVVTVGFAEFCDSLVESREKLHNGWAKMNPEMKPSSNPYKVVKTCYEIDDLDWSKMNIDGGGEGVEGKYFRSALLVAVIGSWGLVIVWFIQMMLNFGQCCRGCSCAKAEEKQKMSKSMMVAQRRSRMATPIGTPGHMTPRGYGMPGHMTPPVMGGPPSSMGPPQGAYGMGAPPPHGMGPPHGRGPPHGGLPPHMAGHRNMAYEYGGVGHGPLPPKS